MTSRKSQVSLRDNLARKRPGHERTQTLCLYLASIGLSLLINVSRERLVGGIGPLTCRSGLDGNRKTKVPEGAFEIYI